MQEISADKLFEIIGRKETELIILRRQLEIKEKEIERLKKDKDGK